MSPISESDVRNWEKTARYGPMQVVARDGTAIELRQSALHTEFVITKKGQKPEIVWTSGLENCYGLALSPDEHLVAFVCELNGVIVTAP